MTVFIAISVFLLSAGPGLSASTADCSRFNFKFNKKTKKMECVNRKGVRTKLKSEQDQRTRELEQRAEELERRQKEATKEQLTKQRQFRRSLRPKKIGR